MRGLWVLRGACTCLVIFLTACATVTPRPANLPSSTLLLPTRDSTMPYAYRKPGVSFSTYDKVMLEPVRLSGSAGNETSDISVEEKKALSNYLFEEFTGSLGKTFQIVSSPGEKTLDVGLTFIDAKKSYVVLSAVSHVLPAGLAVNAGAQLLGKPGTFSGAVVYAVEVRDSQSGEILYARVDNKSSSALDVTSSFTPLAAARAGIRAGAKTFPNDLIGAPSR
jgi:hypothetical protein